MNHYFDIVNRAIELTIVEADNGLSYLEPRYMEILRNEGVIDSLNDDVDIDLNELIEVLKLEVEKRNTIANKTQQVVEWIYSVITTTVEPAITDEENQLIKNVMDYMQLNDSLQDKEKELKVKEAALDQKEKIGNVIPFTMNFAKKKADE